ncbi:MAG: hypothetical protein GY845_08675 [Planctomycetes bacterium]|nr:hypothetical protein [Planctomycetota bacterium]
MEKEWLNEIEKQYLQLTCHNYRSDGNIITKEEKDKLPRSNTDVFLDLTTGEGDIKPEKGKKIIDPAFGPETWDLLEKTFKAGGEFVELDSENYMAARICRLRKIFKDKSQYFFITRRHPEYSIRLNPERSWIIIMTHKPKQES